MNKQIENIRVHLAELLSDEILEHACIDRKEHPIDFQVFRLLTGYEEALQEIKELNKQSKKKDKLLKLAVRELDCNCHVEADYSDYSFEVNCLKHEISEHIYGKE